MTTVDPEIFYEKREHKIKSNRCLLPIGNNNIL